MGGRGEGPVCTEKMSRARSTVAGSVAFDVLRDSRSRYGERPPARGWEPGRGSTSRSSGDSDETCVKNPSPGGGRAPLRNAPGSGFFLRGFPRRAYVTPPPHAPPRTNGPTVGRGRRRSVRIRLATERGFVRAGTT